MVLKPLLQHAMDLRNPTAGARGHAETLNTTELMRSYKTMAEARRRSPSPEMTGRASFSSVREMACDLAQTFTSSRVASRQLPPEVAVAIDDMDMDSDMDLRELETALGESRTNVSMLEELPAEIFGTCPCHPLFRHSTPDADLLQC